MDEIARFAEKLPDFSYALHLTAEVLRPAEAFAVAGRPDVRSLVSGFPNAHILVCGPKELIIAAREAHGATGAPPKRLHYELFDQGGDLPFEGEVAAGASIRIRPWERTLEWKPDDGSLLDLLESQSELRPPAACRSGLCRTCAVTLLDGDVIYPSGVSRPGHGTVLLCCARPATDRITVGLPTNTPRSVGDEE